MSALAASNVAVRLGRSPVLRDLSIEIRPGEVTAIIGPNGAGKSTLLGCLAGLRRPDSGVIRLGPDRLDSLPQRRRAQRLALLEQSAEIAWAVDVRTLVGLGRTPYLGARGLTSADQAAVEAAMARTLVLGLADRRVTDLSGGERARVLIARALAGTPEWLLADEPLAGLDPGHQIDAAALFRSLAAQGCGVVVTLHDLTLAARLADRIVVLSKGEILADGPPARALAASVLARAYGITSRLTEGESGPLIEVTGRSNRPA